MLNSVVLDVAAGLIFAFLSVSLATSTIVEALASVFKWRAHTLLQGVKELVNDPKFEGLARTLYGHALVNPRGPGNGEPDKNAPAYIDPQRFAAALLDISGLTQVLTSGNPGAAVAANLNPQIEDLLKGAIQRGQANLNKVRNEIAAWFDAGMDRVSGVYKRQAQLVGFVVALLLCVGLNIDALSIARTLWVNPGVMAQVKATDKPDVAMTELFQSFPVGWPNGFLRFGADPKSDAKPDAPKRMTGAASDDFGQAVIGWLITAFATLFGAPFWFDALQKIVRLKGAGPSPAEKAGNKAAAA